MSAPKKNWDKSQFELRKKAFERRDGVDSSSISEDEGVLSGRRSAEERYGVKSREMSGSRRGSRTLMSPPGMRATTRTVEPLQRRSKSNTQRGSLTGEYSEETSSPLPTLDRTHTLAIGEETGQKERVLVNAPETLSPAFSSQSQSDDSEREDLAMAAQISILSEQNQRLEAQLREREQERDRLREMLEKDTGDKTGAAYLPPGLPSKVLDGRKVMKPGEKGPHMEGKRGHREEELLADIDVLHKSRRELEQRLHEISEEKRRLEAELSQQREALRKMQDREQDLSKDIETLRDENSHHSGTISKLQLEQSQLQNENAALQNELSTVSDKLDKVQRCYRQAEQENMHLAEGLRDMERDRVKLVEEKMKLQLSVDDGQKTKENYRLTIKKLREENTTLKSKKTDSSTSAVVVKAEKPRVVSKEQQAVDEMIEVRAERTQLQEQLQSAQRDIDSLRAQIKGHSLEQQATNAIKRKVTGHLKDLRSQVSSVCDDLETTRTTITSLTDQQNKLARKQFEDLAKTCHDELQRAKVDKVEMSGALQKAKKSLAKMQIELEVVRASNTKLQSQKSVVADDVSQLRAEIAKLQDQKKLLERQLSQNETAAQEKDKIVHQLESEQHKLKSQLQSSEKNWKNQLARLERNWQDRMAEMNLLQENLSEEKDDLLREKESLEEKLAQVESENSKLEEEKAVLEDGVGQLESQIVKMESKLTENAAEISQVQRVIAKTVVEGACSTARARLFREQERDAFTAKESALRSELITLAHERDTMMDSLHQRQMEQEMMEVLAKGARKKEKKINELTSQLESLTTENKSIREEIQSLNELRQSAVDNLQQLSEAKQSLQLDNQKIHMTLRTEISLLQTKLKSVEDEKQALEARVADLVAGSGRGGGGGGGGGSAFKGLPGATEGGYAEGLRRQVGVLQTETQQLRREDTELKEKKVLSADLQNRMAMLEAENRRLKDTLRSGKEPPDSNPALRKKIIKLSQRNFFLEWEKKDLSDKLQISLRLSRETKEKAANEQEKQLREANNTLQEKVRALEDSLLKRRSAIDSRITETVKENGRLHQQLILLKNGFDESGPQRVMIEGSAKWAREEGQHMINDLKTCLSTLKQEIQEFETRRKRIRGLQSELQQLVTTETSAGGKPLIRTSSTPQPSLPPVLKSLNPSYLSRLAGSSTSPPPSASAPLPSSPCAKSSSLPQSPTAVFDAKEKFQQLFQTTDDMAATVTDTLELVSRQEEEVTMIGNQLEEQEQKLTEAADVNKSLQHQFNSIEEQDLLPDQLQTIGMLQKHIESLEDQVIDRDAALQEIESQMKQDYEQHDQLISKLNFQVIDLRNQLALQVGKLRAKDVYLQEADSRYLEMDTQLISIRKEMERLAHEREQLVSQALPEHLKMVAVATGGGVSLGDVIRLQGDEIRALRKSLVDYGYQMSQLHQQLSTADRQRSTMQAKLLSSERMHQQMKDQMSSDINYLRTLNLQFAEQHAKGDKGKALLEEVRKVKEALRQQYEAAKTERELNTANIKLIEQDRKMKDLEFQLHTHQVQLAILQADKQHALSSMSQDMTNKIPPHPTAGYLLPRRPMSAGSEGGGACRRPNYHFLNRGQTSSRNSLMQTEFAIQIPGTKGDNEGVSEIVNLEEHTEHHHNPLSLGPAVVTDDESSFMQLHHDLEHDDSKMGKHQQLKKIRRHRRTASTGSNVIYIPQNNTTSSTLPSSAKSKPIQHNIVKPKPTKHPNRPGSAGSNPVIDFHRGAQSPEQIKETAHEVTKGITKLINDGGRGDDTSLTVPGEGGSAEKSVRMRRVRSGGVRLADSASGDKVDGGGGEGEGHKQDHKISLTSSLPLGLGNKMKHKYSELPRNKQSGKVSETADTHSTAEPGAVTSRKIPGIGTSKPTGWLSRPFERIFSSSQNKDKGGAVSNEATNSNSENSKTVPSGSGTVDTSASTAATHSKFRALPADLSRTPSLVSTTSTISTFPPSTLPSRNPSFAYDGGCESSPHSLESVEIGDSIENLLALQSGKMNFSYFIPIRPTKDTTSSSDDDSVRGYRQHSRRKRSSGTNTDTTHSTQQSKDEDNNSNSSNDSDQLQSGGSYIRGSQTDGGKSSAPVCRHESISITAMEDCPTDHEVDEKAALLKKSFPRDRQGRLRTSSTGSIHICYSDSNTSMEDVSKMM